MIGWVSNLLFHNEPLEQLKNCDAEFRRQLESVQRRQDEIDTAKLQKSLEKIDELFTKADLAWASMHALLIQDLQQVESMQTLHQETEEDCIHLNQFR